MVARASLPRREFIAALLGLGQVIAERADAAVFTYNSLDAGTGITLTVGNLNVNGGTAGWHSVRSTGSFTSGMKLYWESSAGHPIVTNTQAFGIMNGSATLNGGGPGGDPAANNGIGYFDNGAIGMMNTLVTTLASYTTGDVLAIAADFQRGLAWFRKNNGAWNNGTGAADPVHGVAGLDISAITGPFYAGSGINGALSTNQANFGQNAFSGAIPSGFRSPLGFAPSYVPMLFGD